MILRPYKRIRELEGMVEGLKRDYHSLKEEKEERLRKEKKGLHTPNALCAGCMHSISQPYGYPYGCKLNNKCKDWEEVNGFQTGNV